MTFAVHLAAVLVVLACLALVDVAYISDIAIGALYTYGVACLLLAPLGAAVIVSAALTARRGR